MSFASLTLDEFLARVAAKSPAPGGGAVASAVGALAAALAQMVVAYSAGKKSLAAHEPALRASLARLSRARALLLALADEDAAAYGVVNELMKLPEGDPRRKAEWDEAARACVQAPMGVLAAGVDLLRHMQTLAGVTNRQLRSDLAIAAVLADACCRASKWNVAINLPLLPEGERARVLDAVSAMLKHSADLRDEIEKVCEP